MEGKESYLKEKCPNKYNVQKRFYTIFANCKEIHILGGPAESCYKHIRFLRSPEIGARRVHSYEYYKEVHLLQKAYCDLEGVKQVKFIHGDILSAPNADDIGLELDYCKTIDSFIEHVKKFTSKNTIFTFALRTGKKRDGEKPNGWYKEYTISKFFSLRNESILQKIETPNYKDITIITDRGIYIITVYCDTQSMMVISRIN